MNLQDLFTRWRGASLHTKVLGLLLVSTAFLALMVAQEQLRRQMGTEIVLRAHPVDPRDLLRGAYVALAYDIERVHLPDLPAPADPSGWKAGDELFLGLAPENGAWKPVSLGREKPAAGPFVRAIYQRREDYADVTAPGANMPVDILIDIGADHYYADEITAKALENDIRENGLDIILAVGGDGKLSIKGLVLNGQKQYERLF
jgi:uncharacterized membrane-anchored protein